MLNYKNVCLIITCLIFATCAESELTPKKEESGVQKVTWETVFDEEVAELNSDLEPGKLTMDLGVYFPSNLDPGFDKVTMPAILEGLKAAKEIYEPTGVQINILWIKTGEVNPAYFAIQANEVPGVAVSEYANTYVHMGRNPAKVTAKANEAFQSIIEDAPDNRNTLYMVVLQDVFYPFLEVAEGRNWMIKTVRTGGLSFPPYSYGGSIDDRIRGMFTITNLQRDDRARRTIAHEIGHKVINVSHEYKETSPEHEVYGEGGLMIYGSGEEILAGEEGRWHIERLHLSPFLYMLNEDGSKEWNPDFEENGHYYDPIYGDYVIHFEGTAQIDKDW